MIDSNVLRNRIEARKDFECFLDDAKAMYTEDALAAMYAAMLLSIPEAYLPKPEVRVMTDAEARKLRNTELTFGKHAGELIKDVPLSYIETLADTGLTFARYLRSDVATADYARQT